MKEKKHYYDIDKKLKEIKKIMEQEIKDIEEFDKRYNKIKEMNKGEDKNDNSRELT